MIVEVEKQRHGIDLIKIDNDETNIVFTNFGARIVSWKYHDNNIVLGNRVEADEFIHQIRIISVLLSVAIFGRIGNAKFHLNDEEYQLEANNNVHHLHGGSNGLDKRLLITTFKIISRILRLLLQFN